jgi:mono/diheme cytochrome c family protein
MNVYIRVSFFLKIYSMKKILVLASIAVFLFACGGGDGPPASPEELAKGKETFGKLCVACHGSNGDMALNGAKKFGESILTLDERVLVITHGRNLMTPFKGILKEEEIKAVAAYTLELTKLSKK